MLSKFYKPYVWSTVQKYDTLLCMSWDRQADGVAPFDYGEE